MLRILADSRGLAIRQLGEALMSEDERMAKARKKERLDRAIEQVCASKCGRGRVSIVPGRLMVSEHCV